MLSAAQFSFALKIKYCKRSEKLAQIRWENMLRKGWTAAHIKRVKILRSSVFLLRNLEKSCSLLNALLPCPRLMIRIFAEV